VPIPSEEVVRLMRETFASGSDSSIDQLLDEHIRFYIPGRNPFARTYFGLNDVLALFKKARAHRHQHPLTVRGLNLSSSKHHVVERSARQAVVNGQPVEWYQNTLYFFVQEKLVEGRLYVYVSDLEAYDRYWSLEQQTGANDSKFAPGAANLATSAP
jgi:hypothetical protein